MDKSKFLERFSNALKWYLGMDEAEDIMIDYKDILRQDSAEAAALLSEDPKGLAKKLSVPGNYGKWLLSFSALALFIILECFFTLYINYRVGIKISVLAFSLGILGSAVSVKARRGETLSPPEQKKIQISCLILGLFFTIEVLMVGAVYFQFSNVMIIVNTIKCMSVILLAAGIASLFYIRMKDYRWFGVYIICLTLILFSCIILFTLYDMDAAAPYGIEQLKVVGCGGMLSLVAFIMAIRWSNIC